MQRILPPCASIARRDRPCWLRQAVDRRAVVHSRRDARAAAFVAAGVSGRTRCLAAHFSGHWHGCGTAELARAAFSVRDTAAATEVAAILIRPAAHGVAEVPGVHLGRGGPAQDKKRPEAQCPDGPPARARLVQRPGQAIDPGAIHRVPPRHGLWPVPLQSCRTVGASGVGITRDDWVTSPGPLRIEALAGDCGLSVSRGSPGHRRRTCRYDRPVVTACSAALMYQFTYQHTRSGRSGRRR